MERSVLQAAAAEARFDGYRKSAAVFDPATMPHPVVAARGRRSSQDRSPRSHGASDAELVGVETDWAGTVIASSSRKHVAPPAEVRCAGQRARDRLRKSSCRARGASRGALCGDGLGSRCPAVAAAVVALVGVAAVVPAC
jgi:hypothetical protein